MRQARALEVTAARAVVRGVDLGLGRRLGVGLVAVGMGQDADRPLALGGGLGSAVAIRYRLMIFQVWREHFP